MALFDFSEKPYGNKYQGKTLACCFHAHSDYSIDGASTSEHMIRRMAELEYSHITITEHGTLGSAALIHKIANNPKKNLNLKVIHGVEGYIYWPNDPKPKRTCHITIFFKTEEAFRAYCKLTPLIYSPPRVQNKANDYKPCMKWEDFLVLAATNEIIVGTGCVGSWLNKPIADEGDIAEATIRMAMMIEAVGVENIYDEWIVDDLSYDVKRATPDSLEELIQNECKPWFHSPDFGAECNRVRWESISRPLGIKRVASQDAHYARKADKVIQDNKRWSFGLIMSYFQHLKGAEEFALLTRQTQKHIKPAEIGELIDNTHEFVTHFNNYKFTTQKERGFLIPKHSSNPKQELYERIANVGNIDMNDSVYRERIEYELSVLSCNPQYDGMSYILLASDIVEMSKKNEILVGVRGSAGGSLVCYAIGLSVIDPILYDLQFERFTTEGRIKTGSVADIDMDFSNKDKILTVLSEVFGDKIALISIDTLLRPKTAIKDIERFVLGSVRAETEKMCTEMEAVPQGVDSNDWLFGYTNDESEHVAGEIDTNDVLRQYADANPEIWASVLRMINIMRQKGVHASGVLITPEPVSSLLPMIRIGKADDNQLVTAYGPSECEYIGIPKIDILGVTKMMVIEEAVRQIKNRRGLQLEWGKFPHSEDVYKEIYWKGNTSAIFQATEGITDLCQKCLPDSIETLGNLIALFRPSCLDAPSPLPAYKNMVDYYVAVKKKEIKPVYVNPELESVYGSTAGVPLFQEQQLRLFRDFADYTYETAEGVRRAISKKDAKALAEHGGKLKDKLAQRGWTSEQAKMMIDVVVASATYGFNKCISGDEVIRRRRLKTFNTPTIREMFLIRNSLEYATQRGRKDLHFEYKNYGFGVGLSLDDRGKLYHNKIRNIYSQGIRPVVFVSLSNGSVFEVTPNHKVPTTKGIKLAGDLVYGDKLFTIGRRVAKVRSVEENGEIDVYDVEMEAPHHTLFLDGSDIAVCNSHSTAYAIVSYHTAFLKHFYPMEFMCAELTVETIKGTNEEKLQQYGHELRNTILPPCVLKSDARKWLIEGDKLRTPLLAVKGCGDIFVEHLLKLVKAESLDSLQLSPKVARPKGSRIKKDNLFDQYD